MLADINIQILSLKVLENEKRVLEIAKLATEKGITHITAIAPLNYSNFDSLIAWIKRAAKHVNEQLAEFNIHLSIIPGIKVLLQEELINPSAQIYLPTTKSIKYIFIDIPDNEIPSYASQVFYELQLKGYIPIIVNAEQHKEIQKHPSILYHFVRHGVLVHASVESLLGLNGKKAMKFENKLLRHNLIHFIATGTTEDEDTRFLLQDAYRKIEMKYSKELKNYFKRNNLYLFKGTDFHILDPNPIR